MAEPLMHPHTRKMLEDVARGQHHAVALNGPFGAGKSYLAHWLAREILGRAYKPASMLVIKPVDGTIGIDNIREVASFLKLKTAGLEEIRRVVVIEEAGTMTIEAQNALLKSLEEPPEDAKFILTIIGRRSLLPTIESRIQISDVLPVSEGLFTSVLGDEFKPEDIRRAYAISNGYVGLGLALLSDRDHRLSQAISEAKSLLGKSSYERLLEVDTIAKDKEKAEVLLFALKRVLLAALPSVKTEQIRRILSALRTIHKTEGDMIRNPNVKLAWTDVMLNL